MSSESRNDIDYSTRGAVADVTVVFGGALLIIASAFDALQGLSAVLNDDLFSAGSDYLYRFDMTVWGTVHLIIGAIGLVTGVGILMGLGWARTVGMIIAALAMLTNFAFLPVYPLWSIIVIAFNGLVIWALSVQMRNYAP